MFFFPPLTPKKICKTITYLFFFLYIGPMYSKFRVPCRAFRDSNHFHSMCPLKLHLSAQFSLRMKMLILSTFLQIQLYFTFLVLPSSILLPRNPGPYLTSSCRFPLFLTFIPHQFRHFPSSSFSSS